MLALAILVGSNLQAATVFVATRMAGMTDGSLGGVLNKELWKWIRFSVEFRNRDEGKASVEYEAGDNDACALTRFWIRRNAKPPKGLRLLVEWQYSQAVGIDPSHLGTHVQSSIDLRQGFVEPKTGEQHRVSPREGVAVLNVGDHRQVGGGNWRDVSCSLDLDKIGPGTSTKHFGVFRATPVVINTKSFDNFDRNPRHNLRAVGTLRRLVRAVCGTLRRLVRKALLPSSHQQAPKACCARAPIARSTKVNIERPLKV